MKEYLSRKVVNNFHDTTMLPSSWQNRPWHGSGHTSWSTIRDQHVVSCSFMVGVLKVPYVKSLFFVRYQFLQITIDHDHDHIYERCINEDCSVVRIFLYGNNKGKISSTMTPCVSNPVNGMIQGVGSFSISSRNFGPFDRGLRNKSVRCHLLDNPLTFCEL